MMHWCRKTYWDWKEEKHTGAEQSDDIGAMLWRHRFYHKIKEKRKSCWAATDKLGFLLGPGE